MSDQNFNENVMMEQEKMEENERLKRRTIERMLAGAKEEQKRFDEKQKLFKELKRQLEVFGIKFTFLYLFSFFWKWN